MPHLLRILVVAAFFIACGGSDDQGGSGEGGSEAGGGCPAVCTGGCDAGVCTIECLEFQQCDSMTITCPPDMGCQLVCDSADACDASTLECTADQPCDVVCDGSVDSCGDLEIVCDGASTCGIECRDVPEVCVGAVLNCGPGPCTAVCQGASMPDVMCNNSSACTPC